MYVLPYNTLSDNMICNNCEEQPGHPIADVEEFVTLPPKHVSILIGDFSMTPFIKLSTGCLLSWPFSSSLSLDDSLRTRKLHVARSGVGSVAKIPYLELEERSQDTDLDSSA